VNLAQEIQQTIGDVRALGGRVKSVALMNTSEGVRPSIVAELPDTRALLGLLVTKVQRSSETPAIADFARRVRAAYPEPRDFGEQVHAWVQNTVQFQREPFEAFQHARQTLLAGAGDCDCQVILAGAVAKAGGLPVRVVPFFLSPDDPRHVCCQFGHDGAWHWAETTIPAQYGEHPFDAARRLGVKGREDITGHGQSTHGA
jgi:transglutaminase-like putative cysteine protease